MYLHENVVRVNRRGSGRVQRSAGAYFVTSTCPLAVNDVPPFTSGIRSFVLNLSPETGRPRMYTFELRHDGMMARTPI